MSQGTGTGTNQSGGQTEIATTSEKPKVLRYLNDYRKKLALLKVKSFYASHLCKKQCLQNNLKGNNDTCMSACDQWLKSYFELKAKTNPDLSGEVLLSSETLPKDQQLQYQKKIAIKKQEMREYLGTLQKFIDVKIEESSKK